MHFEQNMFYKFYGAHEMPSMLFQIFSSLMTLI